MTHEDRIKEIEAQAAKVVEVREKLRDMIDALPPEFMELRVSPAVICAAGCGCAALPLDVEEEAPRGRLN